MREKAVSHCVRKHVPYRRAFSHTRRAGYSRSATHKEGTCHLKKRSPYLSKEKEPDKYRFLFKPRGLSPKSPCFAFPGTYTLRAGADPLFLSIRLSVPTEALLSRRQSARRPYITRNGNLITGRVSSSGYFRPFGLQSTHLRGANPKIIISHSKKTVTDPVKQTPFY